MQIDPDYEVTLDHNYLNNSRTVESQRGAVSKLTTYWLFLTQYLAQMLSWLA